MATAKKIAKQSKEGLQKGKVGYQARVLSAKKTATKSKQANQQEEEGGLEKALEAEAGSGIENVFSHSTEQSHKRLPPYQNYEHNWSEQLVGYHKRLKLLPGKKLRHMIKEGWNLFRIFTDPEDHSDPYKKIEKTNTIFIPGYLQLPANISTLERNSKKEMVYAGTSDIDALYRLISYGAQRHGYVNLVGFSDGGLAIQELRKKFGSAVDDKVGRYLAVGALPINSPKVINVAGESDFLASTEPGYGGHYGKNTRTHFVPGIGHAGLIYSPEAGKLVGKLLDTPPWRATYMPGSLITTQSIQNYLDMGRN